MNSFMLSVHVATAQRARGSVVTNMLDNTINTHRRVVATREPRVVRTGLLARHADTTSGGVRVERSRTGTPGGNVLLERNRGTSCGRRTGTTTLLLLLLGRLLLPLPLRRPSDNGSTTRTCTFVAASVRDNAGETDPDVE